jgi:hypothetical protein
MVVLPGVLRCRPLRRTVQVRLGPNILRLPGGTPILVVSRQPFMKYPGYGVSRSFCPAHMVDPRISLYLRRLAIETPVRLAMRPRVSPL